MPAKPALQVVWFKRDLRVHDHEPLYTAATSGRVLPLLVIEPEWWAQPDMSARQYAFYSECVAEVAQDLAALGAPLITRVGDVVEILADLGSQFDIGGLWSHEETGSDWTYRRDLRVAAWCSQNGIPWREFRQDGVVRRLRTRNGWANRWDRLMAEAPTPPPEGLPALPLNLEPQAVPAPGDVRLAPDDPPLRQSGGRTNALTTLSSFLEERGEPYRAAMSSPITGEQACSRLSPYLAWGAVSMREVAQATWRRQRELKRIGAKGTSRWRGSLSSFTGRLHWHCHFMQKLEDEPRIEFQNLHPAYNTIRKPEETDKARLEAWSRGETGLPYVDACMRYLAATGWLNFRMRAMLMATASYHLWLDWRQPGLHLARRFTDYEPGIHWPQVQMQSGTTGINSVRIYNPVKQGYDQDPTGDFVRHWVPELRDIEGAIVHEPWKSASASGLLDRAYPMPIVDHMEAARQARQRIYGARAGRDFRAAADAIQDKHGSRKSGMPMTGRRRRSSTKRRTSEPLADQMSLDLQGPPKPRG